MDESVARQISSAIEPLVGSVLAKVTVDLEAQRLGKNVEDISFGDIPALSMALEQHLVSFVGRDLAEAAATRVREILPH